MSLLLPDHDTKRPSVFKVGGRDPDASEAMAPNSPDPLHPVPCDGGWFRWGPSGSFRLDEPRPPLHSHRVGTATLRWLADAHLEVRRRLVNSLLERLRRRLRELGRPLHEGPSSDGRRYSSHAPANDAPPRRTEIELSHPSRSADRAGSGEQARLPAQQPPPPASTRLKAAVFSKKRHPMPQRQADTIWGPTSFLGASTNTIDGCSAPQPHLSRIPMFQVDPASGASELNQDTQAWPTQLPTAAMDAFTAPASLDPWSLGPNRAPQMAAACADPFSPTYEGAAPLEGARAFGPAVEHAVSPPEGSGHDRLGFTESAW